MSTKTGGLRRSALIEKDDRRLTPLGSECENAKWPRAPGFPRARVTNRCGSVSRVLFARGVSAEADDRGTSGHFSAPPVARRLERSTRLCSFEKPGQARQPGSESRGTQRLRDLARDGVFRAPGVTTRAVRSYRTFSPLPDLSKPASERRGTREPSAVYSLWHFPAPLICPGRVGVTHHRFLSCSDFPPDGLPRQRPLIRTGGLYGADRARSGGGGTPADPAD